MRIVIDLQGAQGPSRERGIGRFSTSLAQGILRNRNGHEVLLALNGGFPDTVDAIRAQFRGLLPQQNIRVWQPAALSADPYHPQPWIAPASELLREAFLASLDPSVVVVCSVFEGFADPSVCSLGRLGAALPTAAVLHDLIPMLHPEVYLKNPLYARWYGEQLGHLKRCDLLLANSEASRQEAIAELGSAADRVVTISTGADPEFRVLPQGAIREQALRARYGLAREFVMYTGGNDFRKNIEGLIRGYAGLSAALRHTHQLAVVCKLDAPDRARLQALAREQGLAEDELVMTGFVPDEDLISLYNLCKVFAFPSWHEGFGMPALEAMACGRAVIAANRTSLPEVVGCDEALFDPFDDRSIAAKLAQVLTDDAFRHRLEQHDLVQARRFSWDRSAQTAVAALERLVQGHREASTTEDPGRHRLVYVAPLPAEPGAAEDGNAELLAALARHYDVDVVADLAGPGMPLPEHCRLRDLDWFRAHAAGFDRVLYPFANNPRHRHMLALLETTPGVVLLQDFDLSGVFDAIEVPEAAPDALARALYQSHGYPALRLGQLEAERGDALAHYPCNLPVLQQAQGVIVTSQEALRLASQCYGAAAVRGWKLIEHPPAAPAGSEAGEGASPLGDRYRDAIESFHATGAPQLPHLLAQLAAQRALPAEPAQLVALADAIDRSIAPAVVQRQLLVDISELVQRDARTGIQRVVRKLLQEWLMEMPEGFRVEPVYAQRGKIGYRYARRFTTGFLDCSAVALEDEAVAYRAGDIFLGLDLQMHVVAEQRNVYRQMRRQGVDVRFVVYDLLPLQFPQHFPAVGFGLYQAWLEVVTESDGAVCISQSVANELTDWLAQHPRERLGPFPVQWFHLGADLVRAEADAAAVDAPAQAAPAPQRPHFLMVGTLEPRKGHALVLAAFDVLWADGHDVALTIVGKHGWMVDALAARIRSHPELDSRLTWLEGVSDARLLAAYAQAHCLIAASEGEGFGLPLVEAAQHQLPIIARDIPVFREVANGQAFFFKADTPQQLAGELLQWLALYRAGTHPTSAAMPWLTWRQSADELRRLLVDEAAPQAQ